MARSRYEPWGIVRPQVIEAGWIAGDTPADHEANGADRPISDPRVAGAYARLGHPDDDPYGKLTFGLGDNLPGVAGHGSVGAAIFVGNFSQARIGPGFVAFVQ
jgi:hypothetical protein